MDNLLTVEVVEVSPDALLQFGFRLDANAAEDGSPGTLIFFPETSPWPVMVIFPALAEISNPKYFNISSV